MATGHPEPTLSWERLDAPMPSHIINREGVLHITAATKADEGSYRCVGINNVGDHDQILQIYVRESRPQPSSIHIIPDRFDGTEGEEITLRCESGRRGIVVWIKQGERELPSRASPRGDTLTIRDSHVTDSGRYLCTVNLPGGAVQTAHSDVRIHPRKPSRYA